MLLIDLIRTVFIAWFKNKNVYLRKLTFKRYEYNFAISSTEMCGSFYSLTQIPRPSGHMEKITEFLVNFEKWLGFGTFVDEIGKFIIVKQLLRVWKPAKASFFRHTWIWCLRRTNDTVHDFTKDPIETYIDGDWVKAKGTTLGADNGLGVAAIMAVLEDNSLKHGPLEL